MRVLFYGGRHARVLQKIFKTHCAGLSTTLLVNYELIASGKPFPYDSLRRHDAVVYSPIQHKGPYNTTAFEEYCNAHGIARVCYPWLQWHGYHPGARKPRGDDWIHPELFARRTEHPTFEAFERWAAEPRRAGPRRDARARGAPARGTGALRSRAGRSCMTGSADGGVRSSTLGPVPIARAPARQGADPERGRGAAR